MMIVVNFHNGSIIFKFLTLRNALQTRRESVKNKTNLKNIPKIDFN
jgi:hypothetical protein